MTQRIEFSEEMVGNAHPTKADTLNRFINLITAQGDTLYGTAAATAAALAKGVANTKLFMNAAATAPEWATGIIPLSFSRVMSVASEDVAYTGAGFKPAMIKITTCIPGQAFSFSIGVSTGPAFNQCIWLHPDTTWALSSLVCVGTESAGNNQTATVKTMDADGVTLTWTKTGTPTASIAAIIEYYR